MKNRNRLIRFIIAGTLLILILACRRSEQTAPAEPPLDTEIPTTTPSGDLEQESTPAGPVTSSAGCEDNMQFISDVSIPDGFILNANEAFIKTWRIQNTGNCDWSGYRLVFESGEPMGTMEQAIPDTPAGEVLDISVEMTSPGGSGDYTGRWEVMAKEGYSLGGLTCVISVPSADDLGEDSPDPDQQAGDEGSVPNAPSNLTISGWGMDTFSVTWQDNSDNEDGFKIRRVGAGWLKNPTGPNETSFDIHFTPCGETYEYRVVAFNAAGNSEPSNTIVADGPACE